MTSSPFPDYVEAFVDAVKQFVTTFGLELFDSRDEDDTTGHSRAYDLAGVPYKSRLIVCRTKRSMGWSAGEFRARTITELSEEVGSRMAGLEDIANQLASMSALTTYEGGADVTSQCLIGQSTRHTTAAVVATALVHGAYSILEGMSKASGVLPAEAISDVSAWGDLDFEQIHYDYAHLGIVSVARRGWSQTYLDGGLLTLMAVDNHPHWGGGLLTLLRPSHRLFQTDQPVISTNELNLAAQLADEMPAFGAWCKQDDQFQFVSFAPNFLKEVPYFTDLTIETAVKRLRSTPALIRAILTARPAFESKN